jgi:ABC-type transport system involved in multi-copper enzyme maturation permease subunit
MTLSKISIVAFYTFKEILRSKILVNVFVIGIGMMLMTYVATEFTYGVPERVALDFGLGMLSLSSLAISLFLGVNLLSKEIDSRTIYMVISRPVPRFAFIIGKLLGLMGVQAMNVLLLGLMTLGVVKLLGGSFDSLIIWAILFTFLESLLLLLIVVFTSLFVNNVLSVVLSSVLLILGHAIKETQNINFVQNNELLKLTLKAYHFILPGFYKLNLKDYVLYNSTLPLGYLLSSFIYGLAYSVFLLILIILIFNRKNID